VIPLAHHFFQAAKKYLLRMDRSFYVGDDERDCQAAFNAGCAMVYVSTVDGMTTLSDYPVPFLPTRSLLDAVEFIKETHGAWEVVA
jgi:histidinol phosphatase-like enzyme